jgi:hypothetical protein
MVTIAKVLKRNQRVVTAERRLELPGRMISTFRLLLIVPLRCITVIC